MPRDGYKGIPEKGIKKDVPMAEALEHPKLFGPYFQDESWNTWKAIIKAAFAIPLSDWELEKYQFLSGRTEPPADKVEELWAVCGVRSGKAACLSTPVPTVNGWKTMGSLEEGDYVFTPEGHPTKIIESHPVQHDRPCFEVEFDNRETVVVDEEHEWVTSTYEEENPRIRTTGEIARSLCSNHIIESTYIVKDVRKVESRPVRCITVEDPNGMFVFTSSFIPTHNSRSLSAVATYMACLRNYEPYLAVGEFPTVMILANNQVQARIIFNYIRGFHQAIPAFNQMVEVNGYKRQAIEHRDGLVVEVHSAQNKGIQGYTAPVVICDEIGYWENESSPTADKDVIDGARPRMATFPRSHRILLSLSSPFRQRGVLWDEYQRHWGQEGDSVLVIKAPTWELNTTIEKNEPNFFQEQYDKDPYSAARYYGAEFRSDIQTALLGEWIDQCIDENRPIELPQKEKVKYMAFVDPSGGKGDSMTIAIGHREGDLLVVDLIRGHTGFFKPKEVAKEYAEILKSWGIYRVYGDRYTGNWASDEFEENGVRLETIGLKKSDIYSETSPLFAQAMVSMPDDKRTLHELRHLERRTNALGKEVIDHPKKGKDDFANALCGLIYVLYLHRKTPIDLSKSAFGSYQTTMANDLGELDFGISTEF